MSATTEIRQNIISLVFAMVVATAAAAFTVYMSTHDQQLQLVAMASELEFLREADANLAKETQALSLETMRLATTVTQLNVTIAELREDYRRVHTLQLRLGPTK